MDDNYDDFVWQCLERDNFSYDIIPPKYYHLGDGAYVCIFEAKHKLRIHVRKFKVVDSRKISTGQGIVVSPETWYFFCEEMQRFNFIYPNTSFIANNCVWALNFQTHVLIQNFYCSPEPHLDKNFITLTRDQVNQFYELEKDITLNVIETLWLKLLPQKLLMTGHVCEHFPDEREKMLDSYIVCLEKHIPLRKVYRCEGCIVDSLSQLNHDCEYVSAKEKLESLGFRALLLLDIENIVKDVRTMEPIIFSVVKKLSLQDYENLLFTPDEKKKILFNKYLK